MQIEKVEKFLQRFKENNIGILKDKLVGIYLHGSLVMDCFNPEKSDIDVLVVINVELTSSTRKTLIDLYESYDRELDNNLEVSIVLANSLKDLKIKCPYELYYYTGEENALKPGANQGLISDYMLITKKGRVIYGNPIKKMFPNIPESLYIESLLKDVEWCIGNITREIPEEYCQVPVYSVVNPSRFYAYLLDGKIRSKKEAAEWGVEFLPEYEVLFKAAFDVYTGKQKEIKVSCKNLNEYGIAIKRLIKKQL